MSTELAGDENTGTGSHDEAGLVSAPSLEYWANPAQLIWREWDDGIVVFQRSSNKTHLLNVVSAMALEVLCERRADASALAVCVADRLERSCDDEFVEQIESLLDFFEHLGLACAVGVSGFIESHSGSE